MFCPLEQNFESVFAEGFKWEGIEFEFYLNSGPLVHHVDGSAGSGSQTDMGLSGFWIQTNKISIVFSDTDKVCGKF